MSTITINTFLSDTIAHEELVAAIGRLPAGGDTRTEIIDDETGEVLCTCQRGQVQMTTKVLAAVLTKKQDVPLSNDAGGEDTDENDNDKDTQPTSMTIAGITFTVGDRVQAKQADEGNSYNCYQEKDKGVLINIDKIDKTYPLYVRFDKGDVGWARAEDFDIISK